MRATIPMRVDRPIRRRLAARSAVGLVASVGLAVAACGTELGDVGSDDDELPSIVVSTSILGDVVSNIVGDLAGVEVIIGSGTDPHDFEASAQQADAMREADVLVTNGAGLEEGLLDTIDAASSEGVEVCEAIDGVDTLSAGDDDADHDDADREHHEHSGVDPHFFTDPARMAVAVDGLTDCIAAAVPELDTTEFREQGADYADQLTELDSEVEAQLTAIEKDDRLLVTNHDVFEYLADRYDFEVAGTVVASSSTQAEADAQQLADLAELVEDRDVPAVFADFSSPDRLAETLAAEADVEVVTLFTESLGPSGADTYIEMVTTNAERISDALG